MTNINVVILKGNLTRSVGDDERDFGYAANGQARANISIACNRSKKQGEEWVDEVSYFDVTIWGKTAENLKPYLTKGQSVVIQGYLKQDRWEKDGQKQSRVSVVAEKVELSGNRNTESNNESPEITQQRFTPLDSGSGYSSSGFAEDIPF